MDQDLNSAGMSCTAKLFPLNAEWVKRYLKKPNGGSIGVEQIPARDSIIKIGTD